MTYRGHVEGGRVVIDDAVHLPEGVEVRVDLLVPAPTPPPNGGTASLFDRLKSVIGSVEGLPPDLARNHDHYLHHQPKS